MAVAAAANALTIIADIKYVWGRAQADTTHDDRIQTLINLISDRVEKWCARKFKTQILTETYDGTAGYFLQLNEYPVTIVTYVKLDGVEIDNDDYKIYANEGMLYYAGKWTEGRRNYEVKYTAGYTIIPPALAMACVEWVIVLLEGRMKDAKVDQSEAYGPPQEIAMGLAPFKRMDF